MATVDASGDTSTPKDDDHTLWEKLKAMFGKSLTEQRTHATNKYGNAARSQSQPGGAYADAAKELDKQDQ